MMMLPIAGLTSTPDTLTTNYKKGLNTDQWWGGISLNHSVAYIFDIHLRDWYESSRLRISGGEDKWKDQNIFTLGLSKSLSDHFRVKLLGKSIVFSDKQSGYENDIRTHTIGIGGERLRLEWISASEGPKVAETVKSFTKTIKELGSSPLNRRQNGH